MVFKYKSPMSRKQARKPEKRLIGAFDIETDGLGGAYLDGFTYVRGEAPVRHRTFGSLFEALLERPDVRWYAHNASGYEFSYLIVWLREHGLNYEMEATVQGESKVIALRIHTGVEDALELRDSLALIPMSLAEGAKKFSSAAQKQSGVIDWQHERYNPENPVHVEYAMTDVLTLVDMVTGFKDLIERAFGCDVRMSAASTALNCWYATLPNGDVYWRLKSKYKEQWLRQAYYGGFVFPGHTVDPIEDITSIDRNAAYAAAMQCGVPYGEPEMCSEHVPGRLAVYEVIATTPQHEHFIPCLPYRSAHGLLWPVGKFRTFITSVEYEYALEKGYTLEIVTGFSFPEIVYPFADFCNVCQELEKDPELKEVAKLARNSVYGKFGTQLVGRSFYVGDNPPDGYITCIDSDSGDLVLDLYEKKEENESIFIMPAWACFITANQRLWLFRTIDAVGPENVVYCDTDSVKAKTGAVQSAIKDGKIEIMAGKYGACKIDEEYQWFQCLGPKVYHGVLKDGKDKMRAKGLKKSQLTHEYYEEMYAAILDSAEKIEKIEKIEKEVRAFKKMRIEGTNSAMAVLKSPGKEIAAVRERRITDIRNSQTWRINGTKILPPILDNSEEKEINSELIRQKYQFPKLAF